MRSPQPRAHPSPPSVSLLSPPLARSGFRHLDGYHTRRRSPPAGFATDRGRGSNPRGGTATWSHPRRREVPHGLTEGGLLPRAPAGGIATPPAPLAPCISHPQPTERMPSPGMFAPSRHALKFCPACSLAGPSPISRCLPAPDAGGGQRCRRGGRPAMAARRPPAMPPPTPSTPTPRTSPPRRRRPPMPVCQRRSRSVSYTHLRAHET